MPRVVSVLLCILTVLSFTAGCANEPPIETAGPSETTPGHHVSVEAELQLGFWLTTGEEALIKGEDLYIGFEEVIEDSRCPLNVECIWEGQASYAIRFTRQEVSDRIILTEPGLGGQGKATFLDYEITASLEPYPEDPGDIAPGDYRLRMSVQKLPPLPYSLDEQAAIYTAVIRQLYEKDHTFGSDPPDFPHLYIVYMTSDIVGTISGKPHTARIIPEPVRVDISERLADLPADIFWVNSFRAVPLMDNSTVKSGGVIIRIGNIEEGEAGAVELAGSIYIANLAAGGSTYVLEKQGATWRITGTTGPTWIS